MAIQSYRRVLWLLGGATLVGAATAAGVALAHKNDALPSDGEGPPATLPAAGGAASTSSEDIKDLSILVVLEQVAPGSTRSVQFLRDWLVAEPELTRRVISRYQAVVQDYLQNMAEQLGMSAEWRAQAAKVLGGIKAADQAFNAIGQIPFIGQVIEGVYQIVRMFVEGEAVAETQGRHITDPHITLGVPVFFGWMADDPSKVPVEAATLQRSPTSPQYYQGTYWAMNLPVMSFTAPVQCAQYLAQTGAVYPAALVKLNELCQARPFGIEVPSVEITQTGQYSYKFNVDGSNDLSPAADAEKHIYWVDVWDPEDITRRGPRGFDPANPKAWYQRAKAEAHPIQVSPQPGGSY